MTIMFYTLNDDEGLKAHERLFARKLKVGTIIFYVVSGSFSYVHKLGRLGEAMYERPHTRDINRMKAYLLIEGVDCELVRP